MTNRQELLNASLDRLLGLVSNPSHKQYEAAWREFDRRYKDALISYISKLSTNSEMAKEVFNSVMSRLVYDNFRVLREFKSRKGEMAFRSYLFSIAYTEARKVLPNRRILGTDLVAPAGELDSFDTDEKDSVLFQICHAQEIAVHTWNTMLFYAFLASAWDQVTRDAKKFRTNYLEI